MKIIASGRRRLDGRETGFTLVELLVVVTIIALVLTMLFPAIGRMREKAKRSSCMNNLRQITQAALLFAAENSGAIPHPNFWAYSNAPTAFAPEGGELWRYTGSKEVLRCPMDQAPDDACESWKVGSYAMLEVTNVAIRVNVRSFRANDVLFFETEGKIICAENRLASPPVQSGDAKVLTTRHNEGGHIGCYDGHVEWMARAEWVRLASVSSGLKNRLWPRGRFE
ncbi:MAG: type II secretion system GspH family protein [Verrucomicrobiae bacterium]|nr:type II secretion system GspH family protein [Verrucomicrobiae bacterium]